MKKIRANGTGWLEKMGVLLPVLEKRTSFAVVLIFATACAVGESIPVMTEDVLSALSASPHPNNINITARETKLAFPGLDPVSQLLNAKSDISKELREKLKPPGSGSSSVVTNVRTSVYKFREAGVLITTSGLDPVTGLIDERTLVTPGEVFTSRSFSATRGGTNESHIGEIYPRIPQSVVGWPFFLSKAFLADWLTNAPDLSLRVAHSSDGVECYLVPLASPQGSPVTNYELFLRLNDLSPVEVRSYLADPKPYSTTQLEFYQGDLSSFCRHAKTQVFNGTNVFKEATWEVIAIETDESPLIESIDSFFAAGTHVSDRRFAKPLDYTHGTRLPNKIEITEMLKSPRGVVKYQLATHSNEELQKIQAMRSKMALQSKRRAAFVRVFLVCLASVPLLIGIYMGSRRKNKAR